MTNDIPIASAWRIPYHEPVYYECDRLRGRPGEDEADEEEVGGRVSRAAAAVAHCGGDVGGCGCGDRGGRGRVRFEEEGRPGHHAHADDGYTDYLYAGKVDVKLFVK